MTIETPAIPGVFRGLPFEQYLQMPGVSKHELDLVSKSPAHYQAAKENPTEVTAAMQFGTAAHAWILEPKSAPDQVIVAPKVDRRTKAGKEAYAQFEMMAGKRVVVSDEDARHLSKMSAAVGSHKLAGRLINDAREIEVSCQWKDERTGTLCRCRPDAISGNFIIDLKTTYDASRHAFASTLYKYRYHVQAAYYLDGCREAGLVEQDAQFLFIAVERKPPYGVAIYALTSEDLDRGRFQYERDLGRYAHCVKTGHWFGYTESIDYCHLPFYARKEIDALTGNE